MTTNEIVNLAAEELLYEICTRLDKRGYAYAPDRNSKWTLKVHDPEHDVHFKLEIVPQTT